jgi:hypothetical protein
MQVVAAASEFFVRLLKARNGMDGLEGRFRGPRQMALRTTAHKSPANIVSPGG